MKKFKNDNKGFTLVELIVVLVILAILAAILVPALLGYIDEAKQKQLVLNGKSVYTAAQSVASEMFAKDIVPTDATTAATGAATDPKGAGTWKDYSAKIYKIADVATFGGTNYEIYIGFKGTTGHDRWTVDKVYYKQDDKIIELVNGSWEAKDSGDPSWGKTFYITVDGSAPAGSNTTNTDNTQNNTP